MPPHSQCPHCGGLMTPNSRFCAHCGKQLPPPSTAIQVKTGWPKWMTAGLLCFGVSFTVLPLLGRASNLNGGPDIRVSRCETCRGTGRVTDPFDGVRSLCSTCDGMGDFALN